MQTPTCALMYTGTKKKRSVKGSHGSKQGAREQRDKKQTIHQLFLPLLHYCLLLAMYELLHSLNCNRKSNIHLMPAIESI